MVNPLQSISIILLFLIMFLFPAAAFEGAGKGLLLWSDSIFPTLFPLMIISSLIVQTNTLLFISKIFGPLFKHLFHASEHGVFAVIGGYLCGYPMGAKITAELIDSKKISSEEGAYLLSFCNNTSPIFVLNFVLINKIQINQLVVPGMIIFLLSPIISSHMFYFFYHKKRLIKHKESMEFSSQNNSHFFEILDHSIMKSIESIVQVGGYIICFSILTTLLNTALPTNSIIKLFIISLLEISNGISIITAITDNAEFCWIFALALASFGGICACLQTNCMIKGRKIPMTTYIIEKLITSIVTSLLAFFYLTMQRIF